MYRHQFSIEHVAKGWLYIEVNVLKVNFWCSKTQFVHWLETRNWSKMFLSLHRAIICCSFGKIHHSLFGKICVHQCTNWQQRGKSIIYCESLDLISMSSYYATKCLQSENFVRNAQASKQQNFIYGKMGKIFSVIQTNLHNQPSLVWQND